MERMPTYSYEDAQNHKPAPEGLPEEHHDDESELQKAELINRIMDHSENPEAVKVKTYRNRLERVLSESWSKIKTPKAKIQQDWEITKAQRESPKNL